MGVGPADQETTSRFGRCASINLILGFSSGSAVNWIRYGTALRRSSNLFPAKYLKLSPDAYGRETPARPTRKTL